MFSKLRRHWLFLVLLVVISVFYMTGVVSVPFHPDESTFLYMSSDLEHTLTDPFSSAWKNDTRLTPVMRYRMIDAPLTRYLVGIGLSIAGIHTPIVDWDWSASWQENKTSGALPDFNLLLVGRMIVACFFPLSLVLIYLIGLKLDGRLLGISILLIYSLNPLVLLHTRRVMAEGVLLFTILLALYTLLYGDRFPFLAGLALSLTVNAKHSAALILPAGLLAVSWLSYPRERKLQKCIKNVILFGFGFGLFTLMLNPFLWGNPIPAAQEAAFLRQDLVERQIADFTRIAPSQVLDSYSQRAAIMIAQLYIAPPIFSETGNYSQSTTAAEESYLDSRLNHLGRSPIVSGMLIAFSLLGLVAAVRTLITGQGTVRRNLALLLFSFLGFYTGTLLLIPLAWQRYYLPLVPFVAIFTGIGFVWGIKISRNLLGHGRLFVRLTEVLAQFAPDSRMP
jgi:4-amino-4-deoxy-L-arabinose transferase-like glycosyltransferase